MNRPDSAPISKLRRSEGRSELVRASTKATINAPMPLAANMRPSPEAPTSRMSRWYMGKSAAWGTMKKVPMTPEIIAIISGPDARTARTPSVSSCASGAFSPRGFGGTPGMRKRKTIESTDRPPAAKNGASRPATSISTPPTDGAPIIMRLKIVL